MQPPMVCVTLLVAVTAAVTSGNAGKPSFLILLADDVGAGDVGYGCILNSTVVSDPVKIDCET